MEVIGVLIPCLLIIMGLAGLVGLVTGDYPIFSLWRGRPGRIASLFLVLPVLAAFLITIMGWLGPNRSSASYNILNLVALVGGVILSPLAGWIADNANVPAPSRTVADTCTSCGREILANDQVIYMQSLYVQAGQAQKARALERQTGYRCKSCRRRYCKDCLERNARPHPSGGRACPACGGSFEYL